MTTSKPMTVFEHYVAHCSIAHQHAIRAARDGAPKSTSDATVAFIHKLHRLETLVREMGAAAVFGTPCQELGSAEIGRLFPE